MKFRKFRKDIFIYFIFFYILFIPTAKWFGGIRIGIIFLLLLLIFFIFLNCCNFKLKKNFLILLFSLFIPLLISLNLNYEHTCLNDVSELIRISLYIIIFTVSCNLGKYVKLKNILFLAKLFLIFELFFVLCQRFETNPILSIFQFIWDNEKNWIYRNTGSFSNPNILAFFVNFSAILILISNVSKKTKFLFWFMSFIIIIFSASRTGIISFIIISSIVTVKSKKLGLIALIKVVIASSLITFIFFIIIQHYAEQNKYMHELINIVNNGNLSSVSTFSQRKEHWNNILLKINDFAYFFGLGPGKKIGLKYIDNDYLANFSKYGIFGILIKFLVYGYIIYYSNKKKVLYYTKLLNLYALLLIIYGLTAESFTSWRLMLLFYMFFGILVSKSNYQSFTIPEKGAST